MFDSRLESYFPLSFRWLGYILIPLGFIGLFSSQGFPALIWPLVAEAAGIIFIWTFYGSQIDFKQKLVREYIGLLGLKKGKWKRLPDLDKIFITKINYSQIIWSRVSQTQARTVGFRAYLQGVHDFKFLFSEKRGKNAIIHDAESVSNKFHLKILDCTVNPPIWINSIHADET
jgi:hypothetical protein